MKQRYLTISAICMALLFTNSTLYAQALYEVSLDEKVQQSSHILEGTVLEKTSFWNPAHTMIYTSNKVKLHKLFKGSFAAEHIEILTQGGTVGNEQVEVSDLANLSVGETGLFFCSPNVLQIKNPVTNNVLWDIYSSAQGFIKYDMKSKMADAPFVRYENILSKLYPAITQRTGRSFEAKDPLFDAGANAAPPQSNNLLAITSYSPASVVAGATANPALNLLTINGTDFGNPAGVAAILFDDPNNGSGGVQTIIDYNSTLVVSWTNTQIQVRVPTSAGTGLFEVRDEFGNITASASPLNVIYSVLTANFTGYTAQSNLMNDDGTGGYTILYSTSTDGGGVDLDLSPTKITFQRALNTWKQINGLNFIEGGTTTSQQINVANGLNVIMFDNTNTGNLPLASGVLGVCYSRNSTCTPVGTTAIRKVEFDIVIRNPGVSIGSTTFANGPCYPIFPAIDMESVLLHELGHALNLGHINDDYQFTSGSYLNVNPGKVMHYAVLSGVARKSPDWSAYIGAQYCINPKSLPYGTCFTYNNEMTPLATITESKDECPSFPLTATPANTLIHFDLEHATSNKNTDPQFTAMNCSGTGTGITNTAFYAIKTSLTSGVLSMFVSGYATTPASQAVCGTAGVELALYQVSSCPSGQAFPAPVACRTFNANGMLTDITGLAANTTYLMVVDGTNATKANFDLLINGSALPVRINNFNGVAKTNHNEINWKLDISPDVKTIYLEAADDGIRFNTLYTKSTNSIAETINDNFNDFSVLSKKYYRLKLLSADGSIEYSSVLLLRRDTKQNTITIAPNPATEYININLNREKAASLTIHLLDANGKNILMKRMVVAPGIQTIQLNELGNLPAGNYLLRIWDGEKAESHKLVIK